MRDPLFLTREQVLEIQAEQIRLFGGASGLLDNSLLESALAQPQNAHFYGGSCSLFDLAAEYAFSLSKNHPFRDGNKRVAVASALTFLEVNGISVQRDVTEEMLALVTSKITKAAFSAALEKASKERENNRSDRGAS